MPARNVEDMEIAYLICTEAPGLPALIDKSQTVMDGWYSKKLMSDESYRSQTLGGEALKEHCKKVERVHQTFKITQKEDRKAISEIRLNDLAQSREIVEDVILHPNRNTFIQMNHEPKKLAASVSVGGGGRKNHRRGKSRRRTTRRRYRR